MMPMVSFGMTVRCSCNVWGSKSAQDQRGAELRVNLCDNVAVSVIIVDSLDFPHSPEGLEGFVIELIDVRHVRISDHDVG